MSRISSILGRLRCLLGYHEWVSIDYAPNPPHHPGFRYSRCPDCGASEFVWGYPAW